MLSGIPGTRSATNGNWPRIQPGATGATLRTPGEGHRVDRGSPQENSGTPVIVDGRLR